MYLRCVSAYVEMVGNSGVAMYAYMTKKVFFCGSGDVSLCFDTHTQKGDRAAVSFSSDTFARRCN